MTEVWKQWQGKTVNEEFHLDMYLGGTQHAGVFLTHFSPRDPQKAAIKLLSETPPDAENQLASWQFASTLSHPNLIRIFQSGSCQIGLARLLYVVMEYAEEDLSHVVPFRPLTEDEARDMLNPVLDALAYLHGKGLAHGHIKPANIMASGDQLKLSSDGLRCTGNPIEEPGDYDPPENTSSPAGDVWSLGTTLVEVLTQRLPAWDRHAQGDPSVPETLPAPLLDIARHCLRRDPKRRWTITDIANRLKPSVTAQRPVQPVERAGSPTRSGYLIPVAGLLLALMVFVGLKLLNHSPKGDAGISHVTEKPAQKAEPESEPIAIPAPSEVKSTTPADNQTAGGASQISVPPAPAQAPMAPKVAAASGGVVHQVLPDVSQKSLNTIRGTVRVGIKVSVDPSGNVADATIDSPGPSKYFADLALQAARQWEFEASPEASRDWTLRFEFSPDGTKAFAEQSAP